MSSQSTRRLSSNVSSAVCHRLTVLTTAVGKLTDIREERTEGSSSLNTPIPGGFEPNRVDTIIADVFSLISLMFLTVGKSRESPAIYGQIASMRVRPTPFRLRRSHQQILTHLDESGIYTEAYLQGFKDRIDQLRDIIKHDRDEQKHPEAVLKYMSWKLDGNGEFVWTRLLMPQTPSSRTSWNRSVFSTSSSSRSTTA